MQGRLRRLEGPDGQRQHPRREPDDPGAQHRRRHDRGRERRPLEEDHRRRPRRGRRAEEHDQHDGRPALVVRRRGHARRARGRRGGQARRPGAGQGRQRHVEGPDRVRERPRVEPDDTGAEHRRRHDRGRERRPLEEDHRRRQGRGARAEGDRQHDGRPAARVLGRGDARREGGRHRGQARRPGERRRASAACGRTSPTTSTRSPATSPTRSATSPTSRRPSRTATSRRRSPSTSAARSFSSRTRSTRWSTSCARSRPRSPASPARSAPRASLGGQANVEGVSGVWKDLTDNVNTLAGNLTTQVRNIAQVTTAVANGDLSKKITVDVQGEIAELKDTINTMVDQLSAFAAEVTRVAREVGTEGKLGGQAQVEGVSGTWRGLTESVNGMALSLTEQVRNIADVTTAVANGDLSKKVTVDVHGEVLELKNTINTMVDQLGSFAAEVTRVAREVGTEGKPRRPGRGRGRERYVARPDRVRERHGLERDRPGSQHRPGRYCGRAAATSRRRSRSTHAARSSSSRTRSTRWSISSPRSQTRSRASPARSAPKAGSAARPRSKASSGTWRGLTENVNQMANNLTSQVRNIAQVATAVARGDLSQKITVDARGEILELKNDAQHDGRPAFLVRRRGHARRARGRHRRPPRRPGPGRRRQRHLARPDRVGELHGDAR